MTDDTKSRVQGLIVRAIVETVQEVAPVGAPESMIYLALQQFIPDLTATGFEEFIDALCRAELLRRDHHLLYPGRLA